MFVSSYNTYIDTNSANKSKKSSDFSKVASESFESKLTQSTALQSKELHNPATNYISDYKSFSNKQKLLHQIESTDAKRYKQIKDLQNAKTAYEDNSKVFSFMIEPKKTQIQTQTIDKELPSELQKTQEQKIRHTMVNTYLANDRYHQLTA